MDTLETVTGILVLAALAEALVEYLFRPIIKARDDEEPTPQPSDQPDWRGLALRYTAVTLGVLLCVIYRADLLLFFDLVPPWPWIGYVITGLLVGRGSNYLHDFASRWLRPG